MYQGKFNSKPIRRRRRGKKSQALMVSLIMFLCLAVGGTFALLLTQSESISNAFLPGEVTTYVQETVSDNAKTSVKIENTGNIDAWIRVAVVATWKNGNNVYSVKPVAGTDYTFELGADWIKGNDGFYYYSQPVAPDAFTGELLAQNIAVINSETNSEANGEGFYLNVEILGSGIQSKPASTFNSVWGENAGITANDTALSKG